MHGLTDLADRLMGLLGAMDPMNLALLTGLLTALETTALIGLVVPGDLVVLLAGSTVTTPEKFALVMAAASMGTYAGELGGYAIGRAAGPRLRTSRLGRLLGHRRWARAELFLAGRGAKVLVPIRFVSVLHAVAPVVAGTVRMPLRRFAFWSGLGAVIWAATYTAVGAAAGSAYREFGHLGLATSAAIIAIAAILVVRTRRGSSGVTP